MRGKTKIGTSMLMLSVIVASMFALVPAAHAQVPIVEVPNIINPLLDVGNTFSIDITIQDVVALWSYEFKLYYDTNVLTVTGFAPVKTSPVGMVNLDPASYIDDASGFLYMRATRSTAVPHTGFTAGPGEIFPIAIVTFSIDSRGTSPMALVDLVLTDKYDQVIPALDVVGTFDNTLDGYMMAPQTSGSYAFGSLVDLYVSVREVTNMWGVQFTMNYDPNMLSYSGVEAVAPLTTAQQYAEGAGSVSIYASFNFGELYGLTTADPVAVVKVKFLVLDIGITPLDLSGTSMVDVDGNKMIHGVENGYFANSASPDAAVALDTGFLETHNYVLSQDPDGLITLTGQIKNNAHSMTKARVRFTVLDAGGLPVAELLSSAVTIASGTVRLAVDLPATTLTMPGVYDVVFRVEYIDYTGAWVVGQKGSTTGSRATMVKTMTVEA